MLLLAGTAALLSVGWFFSRVPKEREPYVQEKIPCWTSPVRDEKTGRWITSHIMNQDFVGWVGQGVFAKRSEEHLGKSDRGIAMIRQRYFADMERVARGELGTPHPVDRVRVEQVGIRLALLRALLHDETGRRAQHVARGHRQVDVEHAIVIADLLRKHSDAIFQRAIERFVGNRARRYVSDAYAERPQQQ